MEEKPHWFKDFDIDFIKGLGSDVSVLTRANISSTETALILARDANDIKSDDFSSSTLSVIEAMNPDVHTIVEKVRDDETLFKAANADVITPVATAILLSQEILDRGAIDLERAIFDNNVPGTQFNYNYDKEAVLWSKVACDLIMEGMIPEAYENPGEEFCYLPKPNDLVKKGAIIKYRGETRFNPKKD